ncbi:MAG TPA: hypothetical protein VKR59_07760 [Terriglobales bacterium]|nr:hypothetical protein [Terriglobales bacterium]
MTSDTQHQQQLNQLVRDAHARDLKFTDTLATIVQAQKDMSQRLFGGEGQQGILPYMVQCGEKRDEELKKSFKEINDRLTSLETWRTGTKRWIAGAVAVLALEGTAFGYWMNHAAALVSKSK